MEKAKLTWGLASNTPRPRDFRGQVWGTQQPALAASWIFRDMKFPIGIQTLEQIIEDGYVYVAKTALVYKMVSEGKV